MFSRNVLVIGSRDGTSVVLAGSGVGEDGTVTCCCGETGEKAASDETSVEQIDGDMQPGSADGPHALSGELRVLLWLHAGLNLILSVTGA